MKRNLTAYMIGLLLFGSNGVAASFIALPSHDIVLLRSFFGGLLLFEAYARIGVSLGMIINYCGPVIVILFSAFIFKEKITVKTITALAFALSGAVLISWQGISSGVDIIGFLLAILSAFAYAAMIIFNKLSKKITGTENAVIQLLSTLVIVVIYVAVKHGIHVSIPSGSLLPVLWIGLLNTGLGCYFYFSSLGSLPAQTVAVCGYLEPLSAVFFSVLILQERMLPLQIAGTVMILFGTVLLQIRRKKSLSSLHRQL